MDSVQHRLAQLADAASITAVINSAFRRAESFLIDRDRIDRASIEELLKKGHFLIAEEKNQIMGCVYVESRGERAYLGLLSVEPSHQKSGLGSKLMEAAEDFCAKSGARFMDLRIVSVRRELPGFYQRRGYVETGTAPFTPGLNPKVACHFVEMSKPLTTKP
ncbi:MAG TPA: GNAT family N-acetyltransferase [Candidatus Solibacter sp.]|nr:GNAT family N-acetyltransferase [Candidatus Solibacter sp.]